jgi:hypothetical protein
MLWVSSAHINVIIHFTSIIVSCEFFRFAVVYTRVEKQQYFACHHGNKFLDKRVGQGTMSLKIIFGYHTETVTLIHLFLSLHSLDRIYCHTVCRYIIGVTRYLCMCIICILWGYVYHFRRSMYIPVFNLSKTTILMLNSVINTGLYRTKCLLLPCLFWFPL